MSEPSGIEPIGPAPDLAGYPTPEALAQGYRNSSAEAQRLKARADAAESQLQAMLAANQRPVYSQPPKTWEDQLMENGVDPAPIRLGIQQESRQIVQELFQPIAQGLQARGKIVAQHPDYLKFEQQVAAFIESDPQFSQSYNKMFSVDPLGAMEFAFLKYGDAQRRNAVPSPNGSLDPAHATIPTQRSGDSRRGEDPNDTIRAAYERYQQAPSSPNAYAYAKARLRTVITDEFLNQ